MGRYILHFSLCHRMWPQMTGHKYHHRWRGGGGGLGMVPVTGALKGGVSERGCSDPPRTCKPFFFHPHTSPKNHCAPPYTTAWAEAWESSN